MASTYIFPGGQNVYVPQLSADLVVEFSRNPSKFPVNEYIDYRIVDKQIGYYVKMLNNTQAMVVTDNDNLWADGADTPTIIEGNDQFTFPTYTCVRRRMPKTLGQLAVEQGGWDILDQAARLLAMQMMTMRVRRIHETLTTSGNWGNNYATATTAGGGTWASSSSTNNYIRTSIAYALIQIYQQSLGTVTADDLFLVFNPNVAKTIATNTEFISILQQQPGALALWEGQEQYRLYGIPEYLFGVKCIVDNTVYNSAVPPIVPTSTNASLAFTLSNSYAILLSKKRAVNSAAGGAYSTFSPFVYEDMVTEVFNEPQHRRYHVYVTENIDTSNNALVAPQTGFLLKVDS